MYQRFVNPTGDGSLFDGTSDAFMDIAMPWAQFSSSTGLTEVDPIRVALGTSADHQNINRDWPEGWSDPICMPEPGTIGLLAMGLLAVGVRLRRRKPEA